MTPEWGGRDGTELPLVFYAPEATAMVTTGSLDQMVTFPAASKVIGMGDTQIVELTAGDPAISPWSEFTGDKGYLQDGIDWWGGTHATCNVS